MVDYLDIQSSDFNFLSPESSIKGDIFLSGKSKINCRIEGEIRVQDQSEIFIGPKGSVRGNIYCHDLKISGSFDGKVHATGKVIIFSQAKIRGEIISSNLVIHPGAFIEIKGHTLTP